MAGSYIDPEEHQAAQEPGRGEGVPALAAVLLLLLLALGIGLVIFDHLADILGAVVELTS